MKAVIIVVLVAMAACASAQLVLPHGLIASHGLLTPNLVVPAVAPGYVAATRGSIHTAPLPGHVPYASHHINLAPAPGTI